MSETFNPREQTGQPVDLLREALTDTTPQEVGGVAVGGASELPYAQSVAARDAETRLVEAAAVREPAGSLPPARTSDREGYWAPATAEQVDRAAKYGFDLTQQDKYAEYAAAARDANVNK